MGSKPLRKNYYKNSPARPKARRRAQLAATGRMLLMLLVAGLLSLALIFGYDLLTQCDYFKAARIEVGGLDRLAKAQVLDQAGLTAGINILAVNLSLARRRLLAHPWIAQARVRRDLPGTIAIHIVEQQPLAILDLGHRFIINTDGSVFKAWAISDPLDLPVVSGLRYSDLDPQGDGPQPPFAAVMQVLHLGHQPGSVIPNTIIKTIAVDREMGLTLNVKAPIRNIRLGYDDYNYKYERLNRIFSYLEETAGLSALERIDLNDLDRVVVYPLGLAGPGGPSEEV